MLYNWELFLGRCSCREMGCQAPVCTDTVGGQLAEQHQNLKRVRPLQILAHMHNEAGCFSAMFEIKIGDPYTQPSGVWGNGVRACRAWSPSGRHATVCTGTGVPRPSRSRAGVPGSHSLATPRLGFWGRLRTTTLHFSFLIYKIRGAAAAVLGACCAN